MTLPPNAHTHLSWAFTEPGVYTLDLSARLAPTPGEPSIDIASDTITFAVGVDPHAVAAQNNAVILDAGHSDIAIDLDRRRIVVRADHRHDDGSAHVDHLRPEKVVVSVPSKAAQEVPPDPAYRFLGRAGEPIHQLPQAVLGRHVHGEIDPHLWQDVRNAMAYAEIIRDTLIDADPAGAMEYRTRTADYLRELSQLDDEVRATIATIPQERRMLITTHDAFAYLARAYDLTIAGFVTPNPATEPSISERKRLAMTISSLDVPAVFLEPSLAARSSMLTELARDAGVRVCPIYGDTFDDVVTDYASMMRANAASLAECLGTVPS